jgi:NAD dependent epimerase/dehydratase family
MKIKAIITGASGMVGEGVLDECLRSNDVEEILVIGRRSCGYTHLKLKEIVHPDMYNLSSIEDQLEDYDACFFCLGMSSVGVKEPEFTKVTYDLTMHFATTLSKLNPEMTFCYVSGRGTNETGKQMWQRVKGKTESDLMKLPFRQVYNFRPGIIKPTKGLKNVLSLYKWMGWLLPIINTISPQSVVTLKQIGDAMINATTKGYEKKILEVKDIIALSNPLSPLKGRLG